MPFVTVSESAILYYEVRRVAVDEPHPWLLVVHPALSTDISFIGQVLDDTDLLSRFNIIAFDHRGCGRTRAAAIGSLDIYTYAADYARALHLLEIPPVHIFGGSGWMSEVFIRMAILFPERVTSLALCGLMPAMDPPAYRTAFGELTIAWSAPTDEEEWYDGVRAVIHWQFGEPGRFDTRLINRTVALFERRYPPARCTAIFNACAPFLHRKLLPAEWCAKIAVPFLVFAGDRDNAWSVRDAQERRKEFTSVPGGVLVHPVIGAPSFSILTHFDVIKPVFLSFIDSCFSPPPPSTLHCIPSSFSTALETLSAIINDPTVTLRNPETSTSFYGHTPEQLEFMVELLNLLKKREQLKFTLHDKVGKEPWEANSFEEEVPFPFSQRIEREEQRVSAVVGRRPSTVFVTEDEATEIDAENINLLDQMRLSP